MIFQLVLETDVINSAHNEIFTRLIFELLHLDLVGNNVVSTVVKNGMQVVVVDKLP